MLSLVTYNPTIKYAYNNLTLNVDENKFRLGLIVPRWSFWDTMIQNAEE